MTTVRRLAVHAHLDEDAAAVKWARDEAAAGDESWQRWVDEYDRGDALIVRLEVSLETEEDPRELIRACNAGVFVERDIHPPLVEQQVAEVVSKDFPELARELRARGSDLDERDLAEMYVHVELGAGLRQVLEARARLRPGSVSA